MARTHTTGYLAHDHLWRRFYCPPIIYRTLAVFTSDALSNAQLSGYSHFLNLILHMCYLLLYEGVLVPEGI